MQPLKFKEYLVEWAEAADLVETSEEFVTVAARRAEYGAYPPHDEARRRLAGESWQSKAVTLENLLEHTINRPPRRKRNGAA